MPDKPTGKPVGKAVKWDADTIARMAEIGPEDVNAAKANFNRLAPKSAQKLLNASRGRKPPTTP